MPSNKTRKTFNQITLTQGARAGKGAPLRDVFFVTQEREHPLASLMNARSGTGGGRGGKTRILLYLSLLWVAAGKDHATTRPASFWADLLGIPNEQGQGSRAIRSNWKELEHRRFVTIAPGTTSGDTPTIRPLKEDASGDPYTIPTGHDGDTYRRVPESAWRRLFHNPKLTGPGAVMYLVSLRTHGQQRHGTLTFPRTNFKTEYGLGETTRRTGLHNLLDLGVLEQYESFSRETGADNQRRRGRAQYELLPLYEPPT